MMTLHYEDFTPGWSKSFEPLMVSKEDIINFALEYDPQPFHIDEERAKSSFVGRLIASGWHSCAIANRMLVDNLLNKAAALGSPGIEETKWLTPVYPGDNLQLQASVIDSKTSKSRPETGLVKFRFTLLKQDGTLSTEMVCWIFFRRRHSEGVADIGNTIAKVSEKPVAPMANATPPSEMTSLEFLEDLQPGGRIDLGSHCFAAGEIIRFARAYDPQYFHLDAEAAKSSLFGGLCASGWHTASAWMRCAAATFQRAAQQMQGEGRPVPQSGPSPGFTNLKWLKPVYAGDTIRYCTEVLETRPSQSRPGWGLAFAHNTGDNQHGQRVFEFNSVVFRQMRIK